MALRQPKILLVATKWWPLSARMAAAMTRSGCMVSAVCPPGHPLEFVQGMATIDHFHALRFLPGLRSRIGRSAPDMVVPCDDPAAWMLHTLFQGSPELGDLMKRSLGDPANFETIRVRRRLLETAGELGIRVPETERVESPEEAASWFRRRSEPAVMKVDGSTGGNGVVIVRSADEAQSAYRKLSRPLNLATAWKRRTIDKDPAAMWMWRQNFRPEITIQKFIPGTPANSMILCREGKVIAQLDAEVLCTQGPTGAALVVRTVQQQEFRSAAQLLAAHLGLSGFFGLDFMLQPQNRTAYLIEMNPRLTQLGHLRALDGGHSLADALHDQLSGIARPPFEQRTEVLTIAFFPQTLQWNPGSVSLPGVCHDVPWEDPRLVRALLEPPWNERRLAYRVYHYFRPFERQRVADFSAVRAHDGEAGVETASPASAGCTGMSPSGGNVEIKVSLQKT